jgi:hypothetical protein
MNALLNACDNLKALIEEAGESYKQDNYEWAVHELRCAKRQAQALLRLIDDAKSNCEELVLEENDEAVFDC